MLTNKCQLLRCMCSTSTTGKVEREGAGLVEGMVLGCEMGYWQVEMMDTRDGTTQAYQVDKMNASPHFND